MVNLDVIVLVYCPKIKYLKKAVRKNFMVFCQRILPLIKKVLFPQITCCLINWEIVKIDKQLIFHLLINFISTQKAMRVKAYCFNNLI